MRKKICFVFPFRTIGGMSVVFSKFANFFSNVHEVTIVDYEGGALWKLANSQVSKFTIDEIGQMSVDFIVLQICEPWNLAFLKKFKGNPRIFFYIPTGTPFKNSIVAEGGSFLRLRELLNIFSFARKKRLKTFLSIVRSKESAACTEKIPQFEDYGFPVLPLPADVKEWETDNRPPILPRSKINIYTASRVEGFKLPSIKKIIDNVLTLPPDYDYSLTLVGYGSGVTEIQQYIKSVSPPGKIQFYSEELSIVDLAKELKESCDIYVGMGSSVLLAAELGIPAIICGYTAKNNFETHEIFKPFFESAGADVGADFSARALPIGYRSLHCSLLPYLSHQEDALAKQLVKTKEHNIDAVSDQFLRLLDKSSLVFFDFSKMKCDLISEVIYRVKLVLVGGFKLKEQKRVIKTK